LTYLEKVVEDDEVLDGWMFLLGKTQWLDVLVGKDAVAGW
jgi:hypothetical protein